MADGEDIFEGWLGLPYVVCGKIFGLLDWRDRHTASLVCRQWEDILEAPHFWREADVYIMDDDVVFRQYLNKYGSYLKILKVSQQRFYGDSDSESESGEDKRQPMLKNLIAFFERLVRKEVQLTELVLDTFACLITRDRSGARELLVESICRFLESQKNLKIFKCGRMSDSNAEDVLKFLKSSLVGGKDTLEVLELNRDFYTSLLEELVEELPGILSRFSKLRFLKMEYVRKDQFLRRIAANGLLARLELLKINSVISYDLYSTDVIKDWRYLSEAYQNIKVIYNFGYYTWRMIRDISELSSEFDLLDVLPVADLEISFNHKNSAVSWKFLEYIGEKFKDRLESLSLKGDVDERKAGQIIELLKKLNALKVIRLESAMHASLLQFVENLKQEKHWKVEIFDEVDFFNELLYF